MRQFGLVVPRRPIIADVAAENKLLLQANGKPDGDPVADKWKQILKDAVKVVPAYRAADGVDNNPNRVPEKPRQFQRPAPETLESKSR